MTESHTTRSHSLSLINLPVEVLVQIAKELDKHSALAFARVHPTCTALADYAIWRDVDLRLSDQYGKGVYVLPYAPEEMDGRFFVWGAKNEACERARRCEANVSKLQSITASLSDTRKRMVKGVSLISSNFEGLDKLANLLEAVSPSLQSLSIHQWQEVYGDPSHHSLDGLLVSIKSTFPSLRTVHFAREYVCGDITAVFHLCDISPRLFSLDLPRFDWDEFDSPAFATLDRDIPVERFNVDFSGDDGVEDAIYVKRTRLLLELIGRSHNLRQLSVEGVDIEEAATVPQILKVFSDLKKLEDVHWPILGWRFKTFIGRSPSAFHSIGRLVLRCENEGQALECIPPLPNLETVVLYDLSVPRGRGKGITHQQPTQHLDILLSKILRSTPKLRTVYTLPGEILSDTVVFDQINAIQERWIQKFDFISIVNGNKELLISQKRKRYHQHMVFRHIPDSHPLVNLTMYNPIETQWGLNKHKEYISYWAHVILSTHITENATDYSGEMVPIEVIKKMALAEGVERFVGRGLEVMAKTWACLMLWKKQKVQLDKILAESRAY